MASLSTATDGEITEFKGRLARAGFDAEIIREINRSDGNELAKAMFTALMNHPRFTFVHGLFTRQQEQIDRVREWNKERAWGIPAEAFAEAEKFVPAWPEDELTAVILVPYLDNKKNKKSEITMTGVERTFRELWTCAASEQDKSWCWDGYDNAGPERLRLLKGVEHKPGLFWEVINLGIDCNRKPEDVRSAERSPHAGILAAAALHPKWVKSMDGYKVPYVWIPGYEVSAPGEGLWTGAPNLRFFSTNSQIVLHYDRRDNHVPTWSVPAFVRKCDHRNLSN